MLVSRKAAEVSSLLLFGASASRMLRQRVSQQYRRQRGSSRCRVGGLARKADVGFAHRTAFLGDTKTGGSIRPLAHRAVEVLRTVRATGDLFFPRLDGGIYQSGFPSMTSA